MHIISVDEKLESNRVDLKFQFSEDESDYENKKSKTKSMNVTPINKDKQIGSPRKNQHENRSLIFSSDESDIENEKNKIKSMGITSVNKDKQIRSPCKKRYENDPFELSRSCYKCKTVKPIENFYQYLNGNRKSKCKECEMKIEKKEHRKSLCVVCNMIISNQYFNEHLLTEFHIENKKNFDIILSKRKEDDFLKERIVVLYKRVQELERKLEKYSNK